MAITLDDLQDFLKSMSLLEALDWFHVSQQILFVLGTSHSTWNLEKFDFEAVIQVYVLQQDLGIMLRKLRSWMSPNFEIFLQKYRTLVDLMVYLFQDFSPSGLCFLKIHDPLHFPHFIKCFGRPMNFDSGTSENGHKMLAKFPYERSNKKTGFEASMIQTVRRSKIIEKWSDPWKSQLLKVNEVSEADPVHPEVRGLESVVCGKLYSLEWKENEKGLFDLSTILKLPDKFPHERIYYLLEEYFLNTTVDNDRKVSFESISRLN